MRQHSPLPRRAQQSLCIQDSTTMVSLGTRCRGTASLQLLSQGGAKLVGECCQDVWRTKAWGGLTEFFLLGSHLQATAVKFFLQGRSPARQAVMDQIVHLVQVKFVLVSRAKGLDPCSQDKVRPPDPGPNSSTGSQLHDFRPEEQLAATEQVLRTILGDLQSHDQAPLLALHTLHSLSTSFLREPHAPAKLKDILHSLTPSRLSGLDPCSQEKVCPPNPGTSSSTGSKLYDFLPGSAQHSFTCSHCSLGLLQHFCLGTWPPPSRSGGPSWGTYRATTRPPARPPHPLLPHHQLPQ